MEAQYKTRNGRLLIKVEGENQKALFRELAMAQEVFEAETECGCCDSSEIRFRVREVDGNEYYELVCNKCGARFEFGQHRKNNTLFPKRHASDGSQLQNHGWSKRDAQTAANGNNRSTSRN